MRKGPSSSSRGPPTRSLWTPLPICWRFPAPWLSHLVSSCPESLSPIHFPLWNSGGLEQGSSLALQVQLWRGAEASGRHSARQTPTRKAVGSPSLSPPSCPFCTRDAYAARNETQAHLCPVWPRARQPRSGSGKFWLLCVYPGCWKRETPICKELAMGTDRLPGGKQRGRVSWHL